MKTRKRRAALKRTAMSGFCQKKDGAGPGCRLEAPSFGMGEDTRAFSTHSGSSCLLSLHLYDKGLYLC